MGQASYSSHVYPSFIGVFIDASVQVAQSMASGLGEEVSLLFREG